MAKTLKIIILFAALMLPVCIFVFLKLFGSNRFDIPIYYQTEEDVRSFSCDDITLPYIVDFVELDSFKKLSQKSVVKDRITIIANRPSTNPDINYQVARLHERLGDEYQLVTFDTAKINELGSEIVQLEMNDVFPNFWKCRLFSDNTNTWVLLDSEHRIRGYYETNEKDIDRLIVEIKILLENENN